MSYTTDKTSEFLKKLLASKAISEEQRTEAEQILAGLENTIHIAWGVEDLLSLEAELSKEEAKEILLEIERRHDANEGVNWEVLAIHISAYVSDKELQELKDMPLKELPKHINREWLSFEAADLYKKRTSSGS